MVVFEARTGINILPVLITTNRRDGDKPMEHQLPFDDVLERVQELRSQNRNAGAYVVHVPGHYLAVQLGAFAPYGAGSSRRPRPGITLGDPANVFYQKLLLAQAASGSSSGGR